MSTHLIIWNPNISSYSLKEFKGDFNKAGYLDGVEDYTLNINSFENIKTNDSWILIQCETENDGIAAYGTFMDPSELNYDDYEKEFYNDEVFMVDRSRCYKLSYDEIKAICPEIVSLKDGDKYTISAAQAAEVFNLLVNSLSNMKGPNEFINYSTDLHPDLIDELGGESDSLDFLKKEPKNAEIHQLTIIDKAILKSIIGQEILHFCRWEKKEDNFVSFVTKHKLSYGMWINVIPHINTTKSEFINMTLFTDELYPDFKKQYTPQKYDNYSQLQTNEILHDVKVITDTYVINENNQKYKLIIDSGLIFEFPDFAVFILANDVKISIFEMSVIDNKKYKEELEKIKTSSSDGKGAREIQSVV